MSDWREDSRFQKECGCEAHTVPHWLWVDRMERERTRKHLDIMRQRLSEYEASPSYLSRTALWTSIFAVAAVDLPRVREKLQRMRRLGIDVLPEGLVTQVEAEWATRVPSTPEPPQAPSVEVLREKLREVAISVEMAASAKEKSKLLTELSDLDRQLRAAEAPKQES